MVKKIEKKWQVAPLCAEKRRQNEIFRKVYQDIWNQHQILVELGYILVHKHLSLSALHKAVDYSQMIWMQNLIEMKKNAIVMVLEVLIMSQIFSLLLDLLLKYFFRPD